MKRVKIGKSDRGRRVMGRRWENESEVKGDHNDRRNARQRENVNMIDKTLCKRGSETKGN